MLRGLVSVAVEGGLGEDLSSFAVGTVGADLRQAKGLEPEAALILLLVSILRSHRGQME